MSIQLIQESHPCRESTTCCCYGAVDDPSPDCPVHSMGSWPPRCEVCGRFLRWKDGLESLQYAARNVVGG